MTGLYDGAELRPCSLRPGSMDAFQLKSLSGGMSMYEYARRTKPTELTEAPTKVKQPTEKQNGETTD